MMRCKTLSLIITDGLYHSIWKIKF